MNRKIKKLLRDPKLFLKDMLAKHNLWKKRSTVTGSAFEPYRYAIICPTYNTDKYIDDFFESVKNQSLGFETHIHILFVDDGSTDTSAEKIARYKKHYPNNVTYLAKENGGLSSARNFGLDYIEDNNLNFDFVTFTDPDDILHKDYFKSLSIFFSKNKNCGVAACNLIYFYEDKNIYKDTHPLKFRFTKTHASPACAMGSDVLLSAATAVYKTSLINSIGLRFDESVKPSFEDCKFNNQLLVAYYQTLEVGFVKESEYYYRQRSDNSSLMNGSWQNKGLFGTVLEKGVLPMLKNADKSIGYVPTHIQRVALFHCIGYFRRLLNAEHHISFLSDEEKTKFMELLKQIFAFIDEETIIKCDFPNIDRKLKAGLLPYYKKKRLPISYIYTNKIDTINKTIDISFFTGFTDDKLEVLLDNTPINIQEEKFIINLFIGENFYYERRFVIRYESTAQNLQISINGKKANLTCFTKGFTGGDKVSTLLDSMAKKFFYPNFKESWIIMDRKDKANDNAEHFYRYIMKNHPEQEIYFAIEKGCSDWQRLFEEGFNLLDYGSPRFTRELKQCKYIASSHLFIWNELTKGKGSQAILNKRTIWLQHGVICNNNANVVNTKAIDIMATTTHLEFESIASQFTDYNLLPSKVLLSGLPRHDALIQKNHTMPSEKIILVMPTWRTWLNQANMIESKYFAHWNSFLNSPKLHSLLKKSGYKLVFAPHQEIRNHLDLFTNNDMMTIIKIDNYDIQELFARAEIMVTDYSSVAFDMALLHKNVFYYQFDTDDFFSKHYKKGYFDFQRDGFGPVAESEGKLIDEITNYLNNPTKFKKQFANRMDIFPHSDGNSSQRIYEAALRLN